MTHRDELRAEASSATERLMDFITDNPGWQIPEPKAIVSLETAAAFAMVYAKERATAEAAAMRERAAMCAEAQYGAWGEASDADACADEIATAIRDLPATGEVGRG